MKINIQISPNTTILEALKQMDALKRKLLLIVENNKFIGVLSIGDIQRAIIKQFPLETPILEILRTQITIASNDQSFEEIKKIMIEKRVEAMPVVDENGYLTNVIYWEDIFSDTTLDVTQKFDLPIVIMAGGKGTRLKPITNVIPKPLIPMGDKTMLEDIMDSFIKYGSNRFYLTVNYQYEILKYYLDTQTENKYNVEYFKEPEALGTAGSLHLLGEAINETFFVTNCDILVEDDYSEILNFHKSNKNELTVVAALKSYKIPYGTIKTKEDGLLDEITEKPELTFMINTGLYILEPHLIQEIPKDQFYHITTLIEKLKSENRRVGVFPVSQNSWIDIGEWPEYLSRINE
jgi:dTDP-glucose pyrophosphorylase